MTETPVEARTIFPLVVFNRPRLGGQTAGQKEGLIPKDVATILPDEKVVDFRPKVVAANIELPELTAPAGDDLTSEDADPKEAASSVTGSATPSESEQSKSTTPTIQTQNPTENPSSLSEFQGSPADAGKALLRIREGLSQAKSTGVTVLPVETTGEAPPEI